jgi:hypothetical protein
MPIIEAVISSGSTISGDVDIKDARLVAISCPVVTSCDLAVRGSFDTTSANFKRIQRTQPNTGDMRFAVGVGSNMLLWSTHEPHPSFVRLEALVAQTDNRTFLIHTVRV